MSDINNHVNDNEKLKKESTDMLFDACYKGYIDTVKQLIANGADVTEASSTAVFIAAERGNLCMAQIVVEAGADPTRGLDIAAYNNDIDMVKYLLSKKGDLTGFRCDPLHYACKNGNVKMVKLFIRAGINVNYCDGLAIYDAIKEYNNELNATKIIKMLLKAGLNRIERTSPKYNGAFIYHFDLIETIVGRNYAKALKIILDTGYKMLDSEAEKAIEIAIRNQNIEILKILLRYGANLKNISLKHFRDTVMTGNYELTKFLLEKGINKEERALSIACMNGYDEIVKLLLDYGYNPNYNRSAPFISACMKCKQVSTIKKLVAKGARIRARKNLALKMAVRYSSYPIVDYLIDVGANPRRVDKKDLMLANENIKELIKKSKIKKSLWHKLINS